jgi:type III pantothenate kinase
MLLAIDVGNTQTTFGMWNGVEWLHVWRRSTLPDTSEDELGGWFCALAANAGLPMEVKAIVVASVVPALQRSINRFGQRYFGKIPLQVLATMDLGIPVLYEPVTSLGPDRLANALGAFQILKPPFVVIDIGTATTFDVVDASGAFVGGAILPGPMSSAQALVARTAKLPQVEFKAPPSAIGRNTVHGLQSGLVLAYAGGLEALAQQMVGELGKDTTVVATGGDGGLFAELCPSVQQYIPNLTLDGLRVAAERLTV